MHAILVSVLPRIALRYPAGTDEALTGGREDAEQPPQPFRANLDRGVMATTVAVDVGTAPRRAQAVTRGDRTSDVSGQNGPPAGNGQVGR